jgi:hypothetical protein
MSLIHILITVTEEKPPFVVVVTGPLLLLLLQLSWIRPSVMFRLELILNNESVSICWNECLDGWSAYRKDSTYKGEHNAEKRMHAYIHTYIHTHTHTHTYIHTSSGQ